MDRIYKTCFTRVLIFLAYGMIFGWLISLIEKEDESYTVTANRLLEELKMEMKNKYNITDSTVFDKFVTIASRASRLKNKYEWTFMNGCAFAFAALTTIGYGHITPERPLGQGLTIAFCTIGLPITMLALKTAGEVLLIGLRKLTIFIEKKILRRRKQEQSMTVCLVVIVVLIAIFMCIVATIEKFVNGWTFLEGLYCWFITLTTIGLGDYLPLQKLYFMEREEMAWIYVVISMVSVLPYLMALCLVSSLLNLLVEYSEEFKIKSTPFRCSVCPCCSCIPKRKANNLDSINSEENISELQSIKENENT